MDKETEEWLEGRPGVIKEMFKKAPSGNIYKIETTGQVALIESYSENKTVKVTIISDPVHFQVFGIDINDLSKMDKNLDEFESKEELMSWAFNERYCI